jgi:Malate:quinone oxidoreductase (Mqo).
MRHELVTIPLDEKDADRGGVLQLGTKVVTGSDGSIAGSSGRPRASTAVPIMLGLLERCFPEQYPVVCRH